MKKTLLSLLSITFAVAATAQTATNFNCNDCASVNHDLFTELNNGKVIVITWVTPNAASVTTAQTAFGAVQMYSFSNPGQVLLYIADDFANTNCATLNNWAMANSLGGGTTFSNAAIDMADYGAVSAQKTVVLGGGWNHMVYFNENDNNANNSQGIQDAIDSALLMITSMQLPDASSSVQLFPNPANDAATLLVHATEASTATVSVLNIAGQEVMTAFSGPLAPGENRIALNTGTLSEGVYFVRVTDGERSVVTRMIVSR